MRLEEVIRDQLSALTGVANGSISYGTRTTGAALPAVVFTITEKRLLSIGEVEEAERVAVVEVHAIGTDTQTPLDILEEAETLIVPSTASGIAITAVMFSLPVLLPPDLSALGEEQSPYTASVTYSLYYNIT